MYASVYLWLVASWGVSLGDPATSIVGPITFLDEAAEGDFALAGDVKLNPEDRLQLVVNYQEDGSCCLLDIDHLQACFFRISTNGATPIGSVRPMKLRKDDSVQRFALLRKNCRLVFLYGGQVVCRGWDSVLANGKAGYVAPEGVVFEPYLQPMEAIQITDNFMREQDAQHMWTPVSGTWEVQSLRDDDLAESMEADKSANAFSFQAVANDGPAIALAEKEMWFRMNYRVEVSCRSLGDGAIGLILAAWDEANYVLFRWASAWNTGEGGDRVQLIEVVGGEPTVLAEKPGGFIPDQWYKLSAAMCDGLVTCFIDDVPVLEAYTDRLACGSAGLYAEGDERAFFDDVVIEDYESFREQFADLTRWTPVSGQWSLTDKGEVRCANGGLLISGRPEWKNYLMRATVTPGRGKVGLEVARQADGQAARLRVAGTKAQLLFVGPQGETLIAERDLQVTAGKPLSLAASVEDGFIRTYVGDELAVEGVLPECEGGGIGLYAEGGKDIRFGNVQVNFLKPKRRAEVAREFQKVSEHPEMAEWASSRAAWVQPAEMKPGAVWWTKGDYFGDAVVIFKVRFIGLRDGSVKVTLGGDPEQPDEGVHLILTATKGSKLLKARLLNGATDLGQDEIEVQGSSCNIRFARQGAHIVVSVDDRLLMHEVVPRSSARAQG